jgi:hypothetical protein
MKPIRRSYQNHRSKSWPIPRQRETGWHPCPPRRRTQSCLTCLPIAIYAPISSIQSFAAPFSSTHYPQFLRAMAPSLCSRSGCEDHVDAPQRYCEYHRCTSEACRRAKRSGSRFCTDHLQCLKTGCSTSRYHPDGDEQSFPFCAEHWWSCREFDCTAWAN